MTFNRLPKLGLRADVHYSRFNSSFGSGSYESVSLSRNLTEALRLEVLLGQQNFTSTTGEHRALPFLQRQHRDDVRTRTTFVQGGFAFNRGDLSYDQWQFTLGYRFDSKAKQQMKTSNPISRVPVCSSCRPLPTPASARRPG